jgi:putative transposase
VFRSKKDYETFLVRLGAVAASFHVEVHAYGLMSNHVHLFVRTREANLGRFMHGLLAWYTQWHHYCHGTYGHLFQGRYKALLVDKNAYGAEVSRYIHLNPVRVAAIGKHTIAERQAQLRDYPWSSYRAMIGIGAAEEWLTTKATLTRWGNSLREQHAGYARFVEEGLIENITDPAEEAKAQSILGRDRFMDRIRRILRRRGRGDGESEPARQRLLAESIETVVERVAKTYQMKPDELKRANMGQRDNEARQVALWLTREKCRAVATVREIGKAMGGVSGSAVSMACRRTSRRMMRNKRLKRIIERLS